MPDRTFVVGDIHGEYDHLLTLLNRLPKLEPQDTLIFLGDYLDRGPHSREVIHFLMAELSHQTSAKIVTLKGNHEDAWLKVIEKGWPEFVLRPGNGCIQCQLSFTGQVDPATLLTGTFFPEEMIEWMKGLPNWYENDYAIFLHATLAEKEGQWLHPSILADPEALLWGRNEAFFRNYSGKLVVCGHTPTHTLPNISIHTPNDPKDLWAYRQVVAIDTACGKEGFLTAFELPGLNIYESQDR